MRFEIDKPSPVPPFFLVAELSACAGIPARASQRQRHVRFRLAAEVDRAVIDFVGCPARFCARIRRRAGIDRASLRRTT